MMTKEDKVIVCSDSLIKLPLVLLPLPRVCVEAGERVTGWVCRPAGWKGKARWHHFSLPGLVD